MDSPADTADTTPQETAPAMGHPSFASPGVRRVPLWETLAVFFVTLAVLALFTPRVTTYLTPTTGDEPFYLMTVISLMKDGDLNECNNYVNQDEARLYPSFYSFDGVQAYADFPADWKGWRGAPYPLTPHPALIDPASRQCASDYRTYPVFYDNPNGELYSKHGLGLSLLVLPAFALGERLFVVFFLNIIGALLAANIYLFARESTGKRWPAVLTWLAFAFTVPQMPYSYLIFPEMPAALFVLYAFRRIRLWHNNALQVAGIGFCLAFLPWLHYRFVPICAGLLLYYIYQVRRQRRHEGVPRALVAREGTIVLSQIIVSAALLMAFFYVRYGTPWPNASDHAGISDVGGTIRGTVGLLLDQQWGLFTAAPIFILTIVGIILMWQSRTGRKDLLWIGVVFVPYFLIVANYAQWWGEWCPPARYLASILPLLALPFAYSLSSIKGVVYKGIYALLLALSYLTMWGFIFQPQWMFNQPDAEGKAVLLKYGLRGVLDSLYIPFLNGVDATQFFPSFVAPSYYTYLYSYYNTYYPDKAGPYKAAVDTLGAAAWRASFWPLFFIMLIILASLLLAWWGERHGSSTTGASSEGNSEGSNQAEDMPAQRPGVTVAPLR